MKSPGPYERVWLDPCDHKGGHACTVCQARRMANWADLADEYIHDLESLIETYEGIISKVQYDRG